ncbi:MAG TPA: M56 family metallopeptidase [Candidatus Krumholzibacteria bacterium]|nr:M56 family metallopeptidase [Candidatus Krumholzibacteria bacterium]
MTPFLSPSTLLDSITPESLAWWLARMTLLAGIACAYLALAHRARPAVRHAVAVGSLAAVALLPAASLLLPAWSLPVLPASTIRAIDAPSTPLPNAHAIDASRTAGDAAPALARLAEPAPIASPAAGPNAFVPSREAVGSVVSGRGAALITWLNVAASLLLWSAMAAISARRFARRAPVTREENLLRECDRARRLLGIERTIDVVVSPEVEIPMVVGTFHPRVMLPLTATAWSRERLAAVLLHELAHVRRRDGLWMHAARVVAAVFWFHPLVWVLSRHARCEAERACDDVVLASGVRGSDYAAHLVDIARGAMNRDACAGSALAFAARSTLEQRIISILSTRAPRAAMSRRALASLACVSLSFLVAVAAVRPTAVSSAKLSPGEKFGMINGFSAGPADDLSPAAEAPVYAVADWTGYAANNKQKHKYYAAEDRERESGREAYSEAADLYNRRRYARAATEYEKAAELGYRRATALYNAGCSYALAEDTDRAIGALRKAFDEGFDRPDMFASDEDLNSVRGDARFQKLMDDIMKSDSAELARRAATKDFERLDKRSDVEDGEWNSVGIDLLRSGDYARAADAFDREFKVSKDEGALYNLACARALGGQPDAALELLERSIKTGSVNAEHMTEDPDLVTLHGRDRFDQLVTLAEDLTLFPGGNSSWSWNWGGKRDEGRMWRKAIPHFEEVAKKYPDVGRAWFNLGYAQLMTDEAAPGTASFKRALDLGYQPAITMYNLACCAAQSGDIDGAFAWLEQAEGAGMEVGPRAWQDDDLAPLESDPRFKKYEKQWKADASYRYEYRHDRDHDHDHDKDKDKNRAD